MRGLEEIKREDRRRTKLALARLNRRHPTRRQLIDLAEHLGIETFDRMLRALDTVIAGAESLALDNKDDRAELIERLGCALGKLQQLHPRRPGPMLSDAERKRMAQDIKDAQAALGPSFRLPGKIGAPR